MDVGKTEVPPLETIREAEVIEAKKVQDGGMEIVHVYRVSHDIIGIVVALPCVSPLVMPRPAIQMLKQRG